MAVGPATIARSARVTGRPGTLRGWLEREGLFSWLMLAPGVLFLLAFVAYPFFYGIFLSLEERRVASQGVFVGLANFQRQMGVEPIGKGAGDTVTVRLDERIG